MSVRGCRTTRRCSRSTVSGPNCSWSATASPLPSFPGLGEFGPHRLSELGRRPSWRRCQTGPPTVNRTADLLVTPRRGRSETAVERSPGTRGSPSSKDQDLREVELGEWSNGGYREWAPANDPEFLRFVAAGRWDLIPGSEGDRPFRIA